MSRFRGWGVSGVPEPQIRNPTSRFMGSYISGVISRVTILITHVRETGASFDKEV